MNLFDLMAVIRLDSSEYDRGLSDAEKSASGFAGKLKSSLGTAGKVGAAAVGAVTAATAAATGAMIKGAGETAAYGDNIDKMSQKMGISAKAYQEWDAIMQHSGTSINSLQAGMKTLANAVENGNEAFSRLGITQEQLASMSTEDLFSATITALQNMEEGSERTYLAGQLLGRGAVELGALLNTSAEDTEAMRQRVHELGGVMSDEAVKAAAAYQDSLQDMTTSIDGLKRGFLSDLLPALTQTMDGLTEIFGGDQGTGLGMVKDGLNGLVGAISEKIPEVMETGSQIITALLGAISENLPTLLTAGANAVVTVATGIVENLPQIVSAGLAAVKSLADGIAQSLPELIPTVVDVVLEIVDTLIDNVGMLVDAAIEIILALANGLIDALPRLIEKIPEIITSLVEAVIENLPEIIKAGVQITIALIKGLIKAIPELIKAIPDIIKAIFDGLVGGVKDIKEAGKQLMEGLWGGIGDKVGWLKEKVGGVIGKIKGWFTGKDGFDEHSPSKWAEDVFGKVMDGAANGLEGGQGDIIRIGGDIVAALANSMNASQARVQNVVETLSKAINASIMGTVSKMRGAGQSLLTGLWNGISDKVAWLKGKVGGVVNTIKSWFTGKSGFDEHSPSKWSAQVFERVMQGGEVGITRGVPGLMADVNSAVDRVKGAFAIDSLSAGAGLQNGAATGTGAADRPIYITVQSVLDGKIVGESTYKYLRNKERAFGGAY